jgi:leucyl aminopeptidase
LLEIGIETVRPPAAALMVPVFGPAAPVAPADLGLPDELRVEIDAFVAEVEHKGKPGTVESLPRPSRTPSLVLLVGVGEGDEAGWRAAGAASARAAGRRVGRLDVALPGHLPPRQLADAVRGFAEGAWLASYRFRLTPAPEPEEERSRLSSVALLAPAGAIRGGPVRNALARARVVVEATTLARDLTNTPSVDKSPQWFADQVARRVDGRAGLHLKVLDEAALSAGGFGGVLAVGSGASRPPRLVELAWRPRGASRHVVLVGKGITFDSGGINIKPVDGMRLMRKDMGGAAAVIATVLGAADLRLPVRVTALAPLAENMISGRSYRPGDVVRHYGGLTTEVQNTDAEGRVVLGDALAYAAIRLKPDHLVDLATLTGAQNVALGKRTAALYSHDDDLAAALAAAADEAGERVWRMPLPEDYVTLLRSDIADLNNAPAPGNGGSILAALFLREFTGDLRGRWAHLDMSSPSWSDRSDLELVKGATGWGVRTLLRWLSTL